VQNAQRRHDGAKLLVAVLGKDFGGEVERQAFSKTLMKTATRLAIAGACNAAICRHGAECSATPGFLA
jgi:hypothetical protein